MVAQDMSSQLDQEIDTLKCTLQLYKLHFDMGGLGIHS